MIKKQNKQTNKQQQNNFRVGKWSKTKQTNNNKITLE